MNDEPPSYKLATSDFGTERETLLDSLNTSLFARSLMPSDTADLPDDILFSFFPSDIIEVVFFYACEFSSIAWHQGISPTRLGQVSRTWRNFTQSYPSLWSTIVVTLPLNDVVHQIDQIQEWIQMSKESPLDIYLRYRHAKRVVEDMFESDVVDLLLDMLVKESGRWRVFSMEFPQSWFYDHGFSWEAAIAKQNQAQESTTMETYSTLFGWPEHFPMLESVSVSESGTSISTSNSFFFNDTVHFKVRDAPNLKEVSIGGLEHRSVFLPWKQIRTLRFDRVDVYPAHQMLKRCTKVQKVTLTSPLDKTIPLVLAAQEMIYSPMAELDIEEAGNSEVVQMFLDFLMLWELDKLSVTIKTEPLKSGCLRPLMDRDGCPLTRLTLNCPMNDESILLELLMELHQLKELRLKDIFPSHPPTISGHEQVSGDRSRAHYGSQNRASIRGALGDFDPTQGLSTAFFEVMHPDMHEGYLPKLEVFEYEGALLVHAIDFLEALILRTGIRLTAAELDERDDYMARLKRMSIKADQDDGEGTFMFTFAEYSDASYVREIMTLVEKGIFRLVNSDGNVWQ